MYEDKTLVCKECGKEFVSRTSPSAARHAATRARTLPVVPVSSSLLPALPAAAKLVFLSSPNLTALFTAASALPR